MNNDGVFELRIQKDIKCLSETYSNPFWNSNSKIPQPAKRISPGEARFYRKAISLAEGEFHYSMVVPATHIVHYHDAAPNSLKAKKKIPRAAGDSLIMCSGGPGRRWLFMPQSGKKKIPRDSGDFLKRKKEK